MADVAGQNAINNKLVQFQQETFGKTAKNTLTATADELIQAVCAVLLDPTNTVPPEEIADGALRAVAGKVRGDKDKIAGRLVDAVLRTLDFGDTDTIADVVAKVVGVNGDGVNATDTKQELKSTGKAAAVAAALKLATENQAGVNDDAGNEIAAAVIPLVAIPADAVKNEKAVTTFAANVLKGLGLSTGQAKSFVDGIFDANGLPAANRSALTLNIARAAIANPAAAGEAVGSAAVDLADTVVQSLAESAVTDGKLKKAIAHIAASTAAEFDGDKVTFASQVAARVNAAADKGAVAGGVINAAADGDAANIVNATLPGGASVKDKIAFAGMAADTNSEMKAQIIAQTLGAGLLATDRIKLGAAMVKTLAVGNPAAAGGVARGLINAGASADGTFAAGLAKGAATNNVAAGSVAAAVADATPANDAALIAADVIKATPKAATGVAMHVSALAKVTDKAAFAASLAASTKKTTEVAVGVSQSSPQIAEDITDAVVFASAGKFKGQAAKIAGAVANAVDLEKAADIGTLLASKFTRTGTEGGSLKLSTATALATAVAKAINTHPSIAGQHVTTNNRKDELGEVAATIVSGVLGKGYAIPNAPTAKELAAEQKAIIAIGKAVMKALSKKGLPGDLVAPVIHDLNLPVDQRASGDIAGSIAQAIAFAATAAGGNKISTTHRDALLAAGGALEKSLAGSVGANYRTPSPVNPDTVTSAFAEVRNNLSQPNSIVPGTEGIGRNGVVEFVGKYEIGSVNDPETPKKNI